MHTDEVCDNPLELLFGQLNQGGWGGGACGTYGEEQIIVQGYNGKIWREETAWMT